MVSTGIPGARDGHRWRRQFGNAAGHALCPEARGALRLAGDVRHRDGADGPGPRASSRSSRARAPVVIRLQHWPTTLEFCASRDTLSLSLLYALTFGGFVGFASFLTTFFNDAYHVSRVTAGDLTTVVVVAGSFLRPVGGWLSDRIGGYRVLVVLLAGVGVCVALVGTMPPVRVAVGLLFVAMALLGMGNGAVFQLVPQRFPERIGLVTGVVGAAGGLGGFMLPSVLGAIRDYTGSYAPGLFGCAAVFLVRPGPAPRAGCPLVTAMGHGSSAARRRLLLPRIACRARRREPGLRGR